MHSEKSEFLQGTLDFIGSPFRTIKLFIHDLSRIDERLRDEAIVVRLVALASMPLRLLGGFFGLMLQNWPTSRSGVAAILGAPAFLTLIGLLGAWVLADKFRSDTNRVTTNQAYLNFNLDNFNASQNLALNTRGLERETYENQGEEFADSALAYAQKLVEIDTEDVKLKYQLGVAQARAGNIYAANDTMKSIAPDDEQGHLEAHLWRARYLHKDKTADEFKESLGLIEKHLAMAIAADRESLYAKAQLAKTYMTYANLLEEQSAERLEYLEKADEAFREIIEDKIEDPNTSNTKLSILGDSVLIRKQLAAVAPEKYSIETEVDRVKAQIGTLLKIAVRYNPNSLPLWRLLVDSASEIRQFDFAVEIADQGIKTSRSIDTKRGLLKTKSLTLRKAALSINKFDDFEMYKKRFFYLCEAVRTSPREPLNYILLLQFIGKENEKPSIQLTRQLGLSEPGDAVPVRLDWLRQACVETKYSGFLNTMIGIHEFHLGNNESAISAWTIAQQFNSESRDFISSIFEFHILAKNDKLDNFEAMLEEFLMTYPEAARVRVLRGTYFFREKKFQEAIDDFRLVIESNPKELLLHQRIKTCYQYMGRRSDAATEQDIIETKLERLSEEEREKAKLLLEQLEKQTTEG